MKSIPEKAKEVGHAIAESATKAGHKIGEAAEQVGDWAKEKLHAAGNRLDEAKQKAGHQIDELKGEGCGHGQQACTIQEHMDVIASCGKKVGVVDHIEGDALKLTKNDSPDGHHHLIPQSWVDHVDRQVHLTKNSAEVERGWQTV